jgi:peroxiredoxin
MFGNASYNYDEFKREQFTKMLTRQFGSAPEPGDRAPDFELRSVDGDKIRLKDYRDESNVVLVFGSATCPLTASSIGGLKKLYDDYNGDDVEFLFVYVREAHPGDLIPAHSSMNDKVGTAELLRDEEELEMPILVDELSGKVHRKYSGQPNPAFLIDRSGRVAYRQLALNPDEMDQAIEELLDRQQERGADRAIVHGGESTSVPALKPMLYAHRALERGGHQSIETFRHELGIPGRMAVVGSRVARPVAENPGITLASAGAIATVLGLGLWAGRKLRERRFANRPYSYPTFDRRSDYGGYDEAVGI